MISRPPESPSAPDCPKKQKAASLVLYIVLVLLALWVVRDFIAAIAWAGVVAIALWPLLQKVEGSRWLSGRTTLIAVVLTCAVALLVVLPFGIGISQALHEAHDMNEWFKTVQENGIPMPGLIERLPFGAQQISAWWQANLAQPLRDSAAMKGLHSTTVMTLGRHFGARAAHGLMVFAFMLVTLFVIFQAGPRLSGSLMKGVRRGFGNDGARLLERMATAVRGTVSWLVGGWRFLGCSWLIALLNAINQEHPKNRVK